MHAILINEDNLEKIEKETSESEYLAAIRMATKGGAFYAVKDYVSPSGYFLGFTVLPAYVVEAAFILDMDAAAKDWDTIYRLG